MKNKKEKLKDFVLKLHGQKNDQVEFEVDEISISLIKETKNSGISLVGNKILFSSLSGRNHFFAECVYSELQLGGENRDNRIFQEAIKIWRNEISIVDKVSGRFLALVDKEGDIFLAASNEVSRNQLDIFDIVHVVGEAVAHVEKLDADSVLNFVHTIYDQTKNDLAGGWIFGHLEKRLSKEPEVSLCLLEKLRIGITESTASLYKVACLSMITDDDQIFVETVLIDAESLSPILAESALWVLGRAVNFVSKTGNFGLLDQINLHVIRQIGNSTESTSKAAKLTIAFAATESSALAEEITKLVEMGDKYAILSLSNLLQLKPEKFNSHKYRKRWLMCLALLPKTAKGALDNLDYALSSYIKAGETELVVEVLEKWIENCSGFNSIESKFTKTFKLTFMAIASDASLVSLLITIWLVSSEKKHAAAVGSIFQELFVKKTKGIKFSKEIIDKLDKPDLVLLIRRMLGFVIHEDELAILSLSLLDTNNAESRTLSLVKEVFTNEVGADYPAATIKRLAELKKGGAEKLIMELCDHAIPVIENYLQKLNELPRLKEISPSLQLQNDYAKAMGKKMQRSQDEAHQESVFFNLVTHIPLKAGRASFSFRQDDYTEPSVLGSYSMEIELPRRHVFDEIGYEIERLLLRNSKRDD